MTDVAVRLVVMGASGVGKTTLGKALAEKIGCAFVDADDLHPPANVAKMRRGEALDDADRAPWLDAVAGEIARCAGEGRCVVIACSALKRAYRDRLRRADAALVFIYMEATRAVLEDRLARRTTHFMPASLVASQLATLEPPGADERVIRVDATLPVAELVAEVGLA